MLSHTWVWKLKKQVATVTCILFQIKTTQLNAYSQICMSHSKIYTVVYCLPFHATIQSLWSQNTTHQLKLQKKVQPPATSEIPQEKVWFSEVACTVIYLIVFLLSFVIYNSVTSRSSSLDQGHILLETRQSLLTWAHNWEDRTLENKTKHLRSNILYPRSCKRTTKQPPCEQHSNDLIPHQWLVLVLPSTEAHSVRFIRPFKFKLFCYYR